MKTEGGNADAKIALPHRYALEPAFAPLPLAPHRATARKATSGCAGICPAHPENRADNGRNTHQELERKVHDPYFFTGREQELHSLINHPADHNLDKAACAGADPDIYHPDEGKLDELSLFRCTICPARLACLALALRTEDADARVGWYGGLGPAEREEVAAALRLEGSKPPLDRATEASRLRASGSTVNQIAAQLGCSRRTVQRHLQTDL